MRKPLSVQVARLKNMEKALLEMALVSRFYDNSMTKIFLIYFKVKTVLIEYDW